MHWGCVLLVLAVAQGVSCRSASHRTPSVDDRPKCTDPDIPRPPTEVDTTARLREVRVAMAATDLAIDAFIIPMDDAHQSEYVSDHDKRVRFLSGFSGSAGVAVVLSAALNKSALWSDGRYFLQGEDQLDCNWIFMKEGEEGVPTPSEWLASELTAAHKVGADASTLSYDQWKTYQAALEKQGIGFQPVIANPVDTAWESGAADIPDREEQPSNPLIIHELEYAGVTWEDKISQVRLYAGDEVGTFVFNYLDENAWLFNLRGTDVPYNPVFYSYSIVQEDQVTLYLQDHLTKINPQNVQDHLNVPASGNCTDHSDCVNVKDYEDFFPDLYDIAQDESTKIWVSPMSSYAIYSILGDDTDEQEEKAHLNPSIVRQLKGRKNPTEVEQLRNCHRRDSATLIKFIAMLEEEVKAGGHWTEISASDELDDMRRNSTLSRGLSFSTISGFGPNGAVIHYKASNETNARITTDSTYLLDSGGQYDDGTTDVTRTFHFGTPTDLQMEAYTRVLMGVIELAVTVWPNGTYGRDIDVMARGPQWAVGMDYRHGTGHGIGYYLNVHEGPGRINIGYRPTQYESPLYGNMFFSDEPGYYQDGEFGVRLETIVMTKNISTVHGFGGRDYLTFEAFTLVPFEEHLIKYELLNAKQRVWLNAYHKLCQDEVGPLVADDTRAADWLAARTDAIPDEPNWDCNEPPSTTPNSATSTHTVSLLTLLLTVTTYMVYQ